MTDVERHLESCHHLIEQMHGLVLDAGCGNGHWTKVLADMPQVTRVMAMDVVPPDTDRYGTTFVENVPERDDVIYHIADIRRLPWLNDGEVDSVFCWNVIGHVERAPQALMEFARILKTDGLCLLRAPVEVDGKRTKGGSFGPPGYPHWLWWRPEEFDDMCVRMGLSKCGETVYDGAQTALYRRSLTLGDQD